MKILEHVPKFLIAGLLIGGIWAVISNMTSNSMGALVVDVKIPQLSKQAITGEAAFVENCAQCHGDNGAGTEQGPPLIHDIYNLGHHGDNSFRRATQRGVQRHHWSFGDMPAQPQITGAQITNIIRYIRELQNANGILTKQHTM